VEIVGAFDVHSKQSTFDYVQIDSGEVHRGKIRPADRKSLRESGSMGSHNGSPVSSSPSPWRGHHRLALRPRGDQARRNRASPGRVGGD
jgi:hypothetical protein